MFSSELPISLTLNEQPCTVDERGSLNAVDVFGYLRPAFLPLLGDHVLVNKVIVVDFNILMSAYMLWTTYFV